MIGLQDALNAFAGVAGNGTVGFWGVGGAMSLIFLMLVFIVGKIRAAAAAEAGESAALLESILDSMAEAIYGVDLDGKCTFCNHACVRMLGYEQPADLLGHKVHDMTHHSTADGTALSEKDCLIGMAVRKGLPSHGIDEVFWRKNGTSFPVEYHSYPKYRSGQLCGAVVTFVDVTESRALDKELEDHRRNLERLVTERTEALSLALLQAESATRAKTDFLANMSHEIRTPMNAVMGLTDLVLRGELSATQRHYLLRGKAASQLLLRLIDDILDFSKVEAGKLELEERPFSLSEVIERVYWITAHRLEDKNIHLLIERSPDVPDMLIGDPLRLGQVLINLVSNAIKFSESGEVRVEISRRLGSQAGSIDLAFLVRDDGIGMTPEQVSSLFQPFAQVDASITRKYGGTGLGLAICKQLVTLMGGEISARSWPGKGSEFEFAIRFGVVHVQPSLVTEQLSFSIGEQKPLVIDGPVPPPLALVGKRVLLVEDTEINYMLACALLQDVAGMEVTLANNGLEALQYLERGGFDLVLMDVQMPVMDGYEATRQIRRNPAWDDLPIIAMTANVMPHDRDLCSAAGMNDFVAKPLDADTLFDVLARWSLNSAVRGEGRNNPL